MNDADQAPTLAARNADPSDPDLAADLDILIPDRELVLSTGETVKVHEYTFMEGLKVDAAAVGLIMALQQLFYRNVDGDQDFHLQELIAVFARDPAIIAELLALSCAHDSAWVEGLADADGQLLLMAWWGVNRNFFVRRLVSELGALPTRAGEESSPD